MPHGVRLGRRDAPPPRWCRSPSPRFRCPSTAWTPPAARAARRPRRRHPTVALAAVLAGIAIVAAGRLGTIRRHRRPGGGLARGLARPALPPASVLLARTCAYGAPRAPASGRGRAAASAREVPAASASSFRARAPAASVHFRRTTCRNPPPGRIDRRGTAEESSSQRPLPPARRARPTWGASSRSDRSTNGTSAKRAGAGTGRPRGRSGRAGSATAAAAKPQASPFRTRHPVIAALVPVGLVVAAIATMVVIKATGGSSPSSAAAASHLTAQGLQRPRPPIRAPRRCRRTCSRHCRCRRPRSTPWAAAGTSVPPSSVGGSGTILRGADGKPEITYIGAEYCPYCAAERWALAVALTRFGTFSDLSGTHSSGADVYPDTQTLSFYGSSYSSPYVDFQAVEEATNQQVGGTYQTLQTPTAAESSLLSHRTTLQGASPSSTSATST